MKEIWKDIVDYEGLYEISNKLRIRRGKIASKISPYKRIITQRIEKNHGYLVVDLWNKNKCKRPRVHVIYMTAFIGKCPIGHETRHLDDNKLNNVPNNLCYGTRGENVKDSYKNNPKRVGFKDRELLKRAIKNRIINNKRRINENYDS